MLTETAPPVEGIRRVVRRLPWTGREDADQTTLLDHEWLVTNGLGGYASGTISGVMTRKYHGLLIAALPSPIGRVVMLQNLEASVRLRSGGIVSLGGEERRGRGPEIPAARALREFRLEMGIPVWDYEVAGHRLEMRVVLPYGQNTTCVLWRMLDGPGPLDLMLRPFIHFRPYDADVTAPHVDPCRLVVVDHRYEIESAEQLPPLRMLVMGEDRTFTIDGRRVGEVMYRWEAALGYESVGEVWSPGYFRARLAGDAPIAFVASTEGWDTCTALSADEVHAAELARRERLLALAGPAAQDDVGAELVLAADQFLISPAGRAEDAARARAEGDEARTVIAGYHWFTDWGRDTMISLEGLTLVTGRHREGGYILRTFAQYIRDGLIPNMFPDGASEGLYHTADATLWFFHALGRYLRVTGDTVTLRRILPRLREVISRHIDGTRFGIAVDRADGLLRQGAEGYQLTWMDAKVDGWVVTPRRGKAVEINALWYNALRLLEEWERSEGNGAAARELATSAEQARESFNRRFWYEEGGYLYDVVDAEQEGGGNDAACRPNQILAVSLDHPVLDAARWARVLDVVRERLLTPVGLRSLAPGHPDYKARYFGDLRARDAAYHQGTVWAWLIGPFVDAWLKVHAGDQPGARKLLTGLADQIGEFGMGSVAEIFDAEPPYHPRGCIAQAWSVAELLRGWAKTA